MAAWAALTAAAPAPRVLLPNAPPAPVATLPPGLAPLPAAVAAAPEALLVDLSSGQTLYARDAERPFLPASITKTMTAYVAFDLMARGKLRADQVLTVSDDAWKAWHSTGSRMFLSRGQKVTVDQLLTGIMTVSANDGCIVLAEGAAGSTDKWVAMMNAEARALGMTHSHFGTPNGWMDGGHTYVSPRDLVLLAEAMITRFPNDYHRYVGLPGMRWNGISQANHYPLTGVPGADGIKTGFTNEAGNTFLGTAQRGGRRLVMVLARVPSEDARARAARALLEWGFGAWDSRPWLAAGAKLGAVDVSDSVEQSVPLAVPRAYAISFPRGTQPSVSWRVFPGPPLVAPVARGVAAGEVEVRVAGQAPYRLPLVTGANVAAAGLVERMQARIEGWFR